MSEFKQEYLGKYLGTWKYERGGSIKYYTVTPTGNSFVIRWGRSLAEANDHKEHIVVVDSKEVYERILSKARGGFEQVNKIPVSNENQMCFDTYNNIAEVLESEQTEARKRKPRKRKLSLLDWVGGLEEYRENDSL